MIFIGYKYLVSWVFRSVKKKREMVRKKSLNVWVETWVSQTRLSVTTGLFENEKKKIKKKKRIEVGRKEGITNIWSIASGSLEARKIDKQENYLAKSNNLTITPNSFSYYVLNLKYRPKIKFYVPFRIQIDYRWPAYQVRV